MGYNARSGNAYKARCPWIKMLKGPTVTNIYIQNVLVRLDEKSNSSVICMSNCRGSMTAVGFAGRIAGAMTA